MSAQYTHDLAIKTGEYTDGGGATKGRWLNVGKVFRHDDGGTSVKLDALPVLASWDGWISVFPRREPGAGQGQGRGAGQVAHQGGSGSGGGAPPRQEFGEDIPFGPYLETLSS